ncbi:MAG: hypothetical protein LQ340_005002, partial [Diploschistes diacapsis]
MTSYLSSLTSHYTSLKRLLPTSLSPDADNSITDPANSHVSRVLRAYYTEKGRPFPPWLGPDPNAPAKVAPAYVAQSLTGRSTPTSAATSLRAGNRGSSGAGSGGGLGDLFDDRPASAGAAQEEPLSLRSRRPAIKSPAYQSNSSDALPPINRVPVPTSQSQAAPM